MKLVVICLKNRTFAVSQTTLLIILPLPWLLWFAWKIVLLQYRKQQVGLNKSQTACCDLLEKSYFCSIANNIAIVKLHLLLVVICLKNRTFAVSQTTRFGKRRQVTRLWFAWKIVLLQYRKQPAYGCFTLKARCDLLEKSYFCSIANNQILLLLGVHAVVICLKNRTFAVSQTTIPFY